MNDTPEDSLARARAFAADVKKLPGVEDCHVDDWASDGFNIFVYPSKRQHMNQYSLSCTHHTVMMEWSGRFDVPLRGLMNRVHALIRKHDGQFEWADGPKMQYKSIDGRRYRDRYDRADYKLSIRFPSYT